MRVKSRDIRWLRWSDPGVNQQFVLSESKKSGAIETGGPVFGHINRLARRITVTRAYAAPPDSVCTEGRFIMGTEGLNVLSRHHEETSRGYFAYLGTWHTHPVGGVASSVDRATLEEKSALRPFMPFIMLIIEQHTDIRGYVREQNIIGK